MQVLITCLLSGFVFSQSSKISITELPDWIQPVQFENADEALEKRVVFYICWSTTKIIFRSKNLFATAPTRYSPAREFRMPATLQ